ncbi:MAG TPA: SIMPL domain-containing protein [Candidatus Paceibacterota bacterium]
METLTTNPRFKNAAIVLAILLIALVAVRIVRESKEISYVGAPENMQNMITVSGKGEVLATPDIATFSYTVSEEALVVSDAQKKATDKSNAILAQIKAAGIEDKDIKTTSYNIYPRYDYQSSSIYVPGKQILAGYVVSQTVEVKVRKLETAGTLLTSIGEYGADNISGLSFSVDKQEDLMRDARDKAITDARDQAKKLANALGVRLGSITSFYESSPYQPMYYAKDAMISASVANGGAAMAPELPAGESKIVSNVTITYSIK